MPEITQEQLNFIEAAKRCWKEYPDLPMPTIYNFAMNELLESEIPLCKPPDTYKHFSYHKLKNKKDGHFVAWEWNKSLNAWYVPGKITTRTPKEAAERFVYVEPLFTGVY